MNSDPMQDPERDPDSSSADKSDHQESNGDPANRNVASNEMRDRTEADTADRNVASNDSDGGAPDSAERNVASNETRDRTEADTAERDVAYGMDAAGLTCDLCGSEMLERHCKILCMTCGYQRDCSDP